MRSLIVRPDAETDIADAALWYEVQSQGLGYDFLRAADACLADVARAPQRFPVIHRNMRRALLRRSRMASSSLTAMIPSRSSLASTIGATRSSGVNDCGVIANKEIERTASARLRNRGF
jgi:hypothetical protein